ncbi:MAG: P1 family peptidase [Bacilli bacterium]|nr:P1 family peptidase [Bacilli bacterium]
MNIIINDKNYIHYEIKENIIITDINFENNDYLKSLIDKLCCACYLDNDKLIVYQGNLDLSSYHFQKEKDGFILDLKTTRIRRFVEIGKGKTGKKNNICDVEGVKVGHKTIIDKKNNIYTGVSVISPHDGNMFKEKVVASSYAFNGFGKTIGLMQVEELGSIETKIALTSTLCVNRVAEGIIQEALKENDDIAYKTGTINPIVMECNDGSLNNSRLRIINENDYYDAVKALSDDFIQGNVGAGTGMVCHGFKGGIGSSSRIIEIENKEYTIGIICNSNFGSANGRDLIFDGRKLGDIIKEKDKEYEDKGSIVCVLATDLPLNERQLKRLLKRVELGIARTGSYAGNGSGDVFLGFSTANKRLHYPTSAINDSLFFNDDYINIVFKNVVEATEEAVLNSLLFSHHVQGFMKDCKSLQEYNDLFNDLFKGVVEYEL